MEYEDLDLNQKRRVIQEAQRIAKDMAHQKLGFREEAERVAAVVFQNTGANAMQVDQFIRDYALLLLRRRNEERDFDNFLRENYTDITREAIAKVMSKA